MRNRVRDDGRTLSTFIDRIDVVCPRCNQHAVVRAIDTPNGQTSSACPARLGCAHCGLIRTQRLERSVLRHYGLRSDGHDPYFGAPLWLVAPTRHGVVFAYNASHLDALMGFVGARLRERGTLTGTTWRNRSLHARLPRWMKLAQNRSDVLTALSRLRERLQHVELKQGATQRSRHLRDLD